MSYTSNRPAAGGGATIFGYALMVPMVALYCVASFLKRLVAAEDGATMVEYAMMLALIGAALVVALTSLSGAIGTQFTSVSTTLTGASS